MAWLLRFKTFICWKYGGSNSPPISTLSAKDNKEATKQIVKLVQWDAFPEAMQRLSSEKKNGRRYLSLKDLNNLPCLKLLRKLNPFLEEELMRAGGRLRNSDNGTNFQGAEHELNQGIEAWNSQNFQANICQKEIDWRFNPPSCSHGGGIWERLIKSVRKHFHLIASETKLDDFELAMLSTEIKRILNDRPITDMSTDPKDLTALTPSMLLSGVVETSLPADVCSKSDLYRRSW